MWDKFKIFLFTLFFAVFLSSCGEKYSCVIEYKLISNEEIYGDTTEVVTFARDTFFRVRTEDSKAYNVIITEDSINDGGQYVPLYSLCIGNFYMSNKGIMKFSTRYNVIITTEKIKFISYKERRSTQINADDE